MLSPIIEVQSGACDEVRHRSGDKDLAGLSQRLYPRGDIDPEPGDVIPAPLDLSGVHSRPKHDAQRLGTIDEGLGAPNGAGRAIERCEDAISGRLYHPTPVPSPHARPTNHVC